MMTPKDFRDVLAKHAAAKPTNVMTLREPRLMDVVYKAETVIQHPGWQYFLDAVESRVKTLSNERDVIARRMVSGDEMGADLEHMKIRLNRLEAEMSGLRFAASLIPQAVDFGAAIATGVGSQDAAGRADTSRSHVLPVPPTLRA